VLDLRVNNLPVNLTLKEDLPVLKAEGCPIWHSHLVLLITNFKKDFFVVQGVA
jgi:hypothetical protein